jgi:serine/threonine-protein phosphatase CPPED1
MRLEVGCRHECRHGTLKRAPRVRLAAALLWLAATAFAQQEAPYFFLQFGDPQLGMNDAGKGYEQEAANLEFAIATANRLRPAFVVVSGDLVNKADAELITAYRRIVSRLDASIPLYNVAGNHDVGGEPTPESLALWRKNFGPDYYSFRERNLYGIVLDSNLIHSPGKAPAGAAAQEVWLKQELARAKASGARHIVQFQHHPWFLENAGEADQYFNIPLARRRAYLDLLEGAGVRYVFSGHYHRNAYGKDGALEMITNAPVGKPLGKDPSGIRVVIVRPGSLEHRYYGFGSIPNRIELAP